MEKCEISVHRKAAGSECHLIPGASGRVLLEVNLLNSCRTSNRDWLPSVSVYLPITCWSSQFMCMWMFSWMHVESFLFPLPITQWKIPIKSFDQCAVTHSPHPVGHPIPSGVMDQNKTQTSTHTHTHSIVLLTHSVATVRVQSGECDGAADPGRQSRRCRPGSKLRGLGERQGPGSRCRTLTRFNHSPGHIKDLCYNLASLLSAVDFTRSGK